MKDNKNSNNAQQDNQTGSYELIRKRLENQANTLTERIVALNTAREEAFGKTQSDIIARINIRTENNCVPRDIVRVGEYLLFGYNVFIGMKTQTQIHDVFALYTLTHNDDAYSVTPVSTESTFLHDTRFQKDFAELYSYYKNTELTHLRVTHNKLLAVFKIGDASQDVRVFRWHIEHRDAQKVDVTYIDNRGERDVELPPAYDFEWETAERKHIVQARIPHVSIFDEVFIEIDAGKLIFRLEDNTEFGERIHQEAVEDAHQSLDDLDIVFARVGTVIVLRITPYNEKATRAYIFDTRTHAITRVDALNNACIQLPEDHGIIFPGGYYLTGGDYKLYADAVDGLKFKRKLNAPNGEDVMFVFYDQHEGRFALYSYNLIKKEIDNPLFAHGYSLFESGEMVIFRAESDEPTRIHPMQLWQTPYVSEMFYDNQPKLEGFFTTIGNAELVRAIAELNFVSRLIANQRPNATIYEDLINTTQRIHDSYHWLSDDEVGDLTQPLAKIRDTAALVLIEFEKVKTARKQARKAVETAQQQFDALKRQLDLDDFATPAPFVEGLLNLKRQKGHVLSLREHRYIDANALDALDDDIDSVIEDLGRKAVTFLAGEQAMQSYINDVEALYAQITATEIASELSPIVETLETHTQGLDALTDVINGLTIADTTQKTAILESVSHVYGRINQAKAHAKLCKKTLSSTETVAEFSAQLALLSQSVSSALANLDSPEECDEQASRLLVQAESLASRFSEQEEFLADIFAKRDEIVTAFEAEKQRLNDERQRRAESLMTAAQRILESVSRRSLQFRESDALNTYFSADSMVLKVTELAQQLRAINDPIKADDLDAQFKNIREQAIRSLRDKSDIFDADGKVITLGKHKFSVNTQSPDVTLLPRDNRQVLHITGTDFYQPIDSAELDALQPYWSQTLASETATIYRAEYLANAVFADVLAACDDAGTIEPETLTRMVRAYAEQHYHDGYEKGVHDHDAIAIIRALLPVYQRAGLMRFTPQARAVAWLFATAMPREQRAELKQHAQSAIALRVHLNSRDAAALFTNELQARIDEFVTQSALTEVIQPSDFIACEQAARYLLEHWGGDTAPPAHKSTQYNTAFDEFALSNVAHKLCEHLDATLEKHQQADAVKQAVTSLPLNAALTLTKQWLTAAHHDAPAEERCFIDTASVFWLLKVRGTLTGSDELNFAVVNVDLQVRVSDLLGDHPSIHDRTLTFALDSFFATLHRYQAKHQPEFTRYLKVRKQAVENARREIDVSAFTARPLSTFVRNKLINDSYLPLIGDNLAKQMGALGAEKRSDLMGLLLLISPPGYGKTTLMEYVANRLGLNFMKVNCPSLGHDITSLDPATATSATAKQELERLNLALEMGNNVMLYLDDIQHTNPEFLQKFISLSDGTRRVDGVWQGESKTYNLRGKRFCIIMAGNPYTESGDVFKIPDMLANRADVYNLGDVLSGQGDIFALSYVENALTSNPTLAPLALRDLDDVYRFVKLSEGQSVPASDFSHDYAAGERDDIVNVLQKLTTIRDIVLKVNQAYIQSAAMDDQYRDMPPFKLQGSYRDMNKLAEKVVPVMNETELLALIDDHYHCEAQLLTTGAEENILAYKSLSNTLSEDEKARLESIQSEFKARNAVKHDDASTRIAKQIAQLNDQLRHSIQALGENQSAEAALSRIESAITALKLDVEVTNAPDSSLSEVMHAIVETFQGGLLPIAQAMNHEVDVDAEVLKRVTDIHEKIIALNHRFAQDRPTKNKPQQRKDISNSPLSS